MLQRHSTQPFLHDKEQKALESFTGSDSWAKKFAKRRDLKLTGARIKELSETDINRFHQTLKEMSNRVKQAGPSYEDAATLMRQAAEQLLLSSIIHSSASHHLMGSISATVGGNGIKLVDEPRCESQVLEQMNFHEAFKHQPDQSSIQNSILRDAINATAELIDHPDLSS